MDLDLLRDGLFQLQTPGLPARLALAVLHLLGVPLGAWCCSNSTLFLSQDVPTLLPQVRTTVPHTTSEHNTLAQHTPRQHTQCQRRHYPPRPYPPNPNPSPQPPTPTPNRNCHPPTINPGPALTCCRT